ncbi:MAG: thioredoxin family protein [Bacteroidales bacterium]|nr:thioredoxin family protein [Bacteroidales bacterium]
MKKTFPIILFCLLFSFTIDAQSTIKKVYNEEINSLEQIDAAVMQAKSSGKFVVCQLGGNWCPWCLLFADFVTNDSTISKVIDDNFVYIHVNYNPRVSDDKNKSQQNTELLQRLGNPSRFGYPVFIILDEKGKVIHIQDSSFLEEGKGYNQGKVLRFFNNWTPKAVKG